MSSENISESFGKDQGLRLKSIRKELNLTPETAAERANVSSQQWRKYERGEAEPKISKLIFLVQEGFSLGWIMTGEGPRRIGGTEGTGATPAGKKVDLTDRRKNRRRQSDNAPPINDQLIPINEWLSQLDIIDRLDFFNDFRARFYDFEMWWQKKTGKKSDGDNIAVGDES